MSIPAGRPARLTSSPPAKSATSLKQCRVPIAFSRRAPATSSCSSPTDRGCFSPAPPHASLGSRAQPPPATPHLPTRQPSLLGSPPRGGHSAGAVLPDEPLFGVTRGATPAQDPGGR